MTLIYSLDPTDDPRWQQFVLRHPRSSVFHTPQWLDALRRTYGFTPVVYTTSRPNAELSDGIAFCRVNSWLTGTRLVSLPFSDHCQPLVDSPAQLDAILQALPGESRGKGWRYMQIQPLVPDSVEALERHGFRRQDAQYHYGLEISRDTASLFHGIKQGVREGIRRAERSAVRFTVGRDQAAITTYFRLHLMTRSKQGVPPQPFAWFRHLAACLGDMLEVHLMFQDATPIAGLVTILYRDQLMWKYIASDPVKDRAGMAKCLMWRSICWAKDRGATSLDMGRCDPANVGLAQFKERWGARRADLFSFRYSQAPAPPTQPGWFSRVAKSCFSKLPPPLLAAAGRFAYRHVA
jgi:GNAT acetyltransferase-like protein